MQRHRALLSQLVMTIRGPSLSDPGTVMYSTLIPYKKCAGAAVRFGITRGVAAESKNFQEPHRLALMLRHAVEGIDLNLDAARQLLGEFIR